jgi:hypothetical protein
VDRANNPYTPNAGAPPRYLAGRRTEVDDFRTLLRRLGRGYTEQSLVITGLRGVGKTVLLGQYQRIAAEEGWVAVDAEVSKSSSFGPQIANLARRALLSISPKARWSERGRRAAVVVKSFSLTVQPDGTLTAGLKIFKGWCYRNGPKPSPVLARKPVSSARRYCIRLRTC